MTRAYICAAGHSLASGARGNLSQELLRTPARTSVPVRDGCPRTGHGVVAALHCQPAPNAHRVISMSQTPSRAAHSMILVHSPSMSPSIRGVPRSCKPNHIGCLPPSPSVLPPSC